MAKTTGKKKSRRTKGIFIAFEGLDGSGLSTQAALLQAYYFRKLGKKVVLTKEQTTGMIGGLIKSGLKDHWKPSPLTLQLLFAADRANHLEKDIEPALKEGKVVITDRYVLSSLAFGSLGVDLEFLKRINSGFRAPDMTFIIDAPPSTCLKRIEGTRFHVELFEKTIQLKLVRGNYLTMRRYFPNTFVIDGNRSKKQAFQEIKEIIVNKIR